MQKSEKDKSRTSAITVLSMPTFITTCPTTSSVNKWTLTYRTCFIKFKPTSSLIPISVRSVRSV